MKKKTFNMLLVLILTPLTFVAYKAIEESREYPMNVKEKSVVGIKNELPHSTVFLNPRP